jgi:hypothetical protein
MPLTLTTTKDRERCFATIRKVLAEFIFPAVSHAEQEKLMQYMWSIENSSDVQSLDATIQGDGQTTILTIKLQRSAQ